jgi:hypothetical protein
MRHSTVFIIGSALMTAAAIWFASAAMAGSSKGGAGFTIKKTTDVASPRLKQKSSIRSRKAGRPQPEF